MPHMAALISDSISVGMMKFTTANEAPKIVLSCVTCAKRVIQLKYVSDTPTLLAPPTATPNVQMVQMIARRTRSLKMVKCVRGRMITPHLTADTAARCQIEHTPKQYIPLLISRSK